MAGTFIDLLGGSSLPGVPLVAASKRGVVVTGRALRHGQVSQGDNVSWTFFEDSCVRLHRTIVLSERVAYAAELAKILQALNPDRRFQSQKYRIHCEPSPRHDLH